METVRGRTRNKQASQQHNVELSQDNSEQPSSLQGSNIWSTDQEECIRTQRRETRSKYRDLIDSVQRNREDLMTPSNTQLFEVLKEADELFENVKETSEAVLDSKVVFVAAQLNQAKVDQLREQDNSFDVFPYADHLLSFMGFDWLERGEAENNENGVNGYLPRDAWQRLAQRAEECFCTAPTFHYMLGSFHSEPPPPKQKIARQKKIPSKEAKRVMPVQLKKVEGSEQEATEKEVDRILSILKDSHQTYPSSQIPYYKFVIDPDSFSRTIENIFHMSFLIRDGLVKMNVDKNNLLYIAPVEDLIVDVTATQSRYASIFSMSPKIWREIIDVLKIKNAMIPPVITAIQQSN
ncbi:non-structural maintenance of chromosomes element 4 homolog A [Stigmatopora nigra]